MANTKSTQHEIDLTGSLNLNKFKADIKPYEGFNERNAPYYGGCLSPLYIKDEGEQPSGVQFYNGHRYYINGSVFYEDDTILSGVNFFNSIVRKTISKNYLDWTSSSDNTYTYVEDRSGSTYLGCNDGGTESYVKVCGSSEYYVQSKITIPSNYGVSIIETKTTDNSKDYIYIYKTKTLTLIEKMDATNFIHVFGDRNSIEFGGGDSEFFINGVRCWISSNHVARTRIYVSNADNLMTTHDNLTVFELDKITYYEDYYNGSTGHVFTSLENAFGSGYPIRLPVFTTPGNGYIWFFGERPTQLLVFNYLSLTTEWLDLAYDTLRYTVPSSVSNFVSHLGAFKNIRPTLVNGRIYQKITFVNTDKTMIYCSNGYDATDNGSTSYKTLNNWSVGSINGKSFPVPCGGRYELIKHYRILYNNEGYIQGISYYEDGESIGTLLTSWGSVDSTKNINGPANISNWCCYYDLDLGGWTRISTSNDDDANFKIIGNLAVFNTTDPRNALNLDTKKWVHFASDWNNRILYNDNTGVYTLTPSNSDLTTATVNLYSSGQNVNWLTDQISSAIFAPVIVYSSSSAPSHIDARAANSYNYENPVDVYEDWKYKTTISRLIYPTTINNVNDSLSGTTYPSGETRYNIPLFFDVATSPYDLTIVRFGETSFLVMYYDTKIRYQYLASSIASFENVFIIQGQAYGVARNKIYAISYANNTIQAVQPVTTTEGLEYIGATIYNAYFYSPTARIIYSFGADNNLTVFSQADTFAEITGASYIPATGSILIGVNEVEGETETGCLYVLNERFGIYRINDIDGFKYASYLNDNSVGCITTENKLYRLKYEEDETFTKKDIILDTAFYGAGSNVVSVNDCWYIRVTDPEHNPGEIKLSVSTLTDIGRQTETRTFKIKATDWDELTDTVYIRFQPKLQRAVGVSLHIESPFKIGYIGVGATPETLQLNKGTI